ncbi:M20/M25/M40 family metallo-hydrolase [Candidatus Bathyarchaeota archaeon]|nr:M20/M25/M40 family metallo-hydrolase [Candidatus Bathyarchaeota archaeon]
MPRYKTDWKRRSIVGFKTPQRTTGTHHAEGCAVELVSVRIRRLVPWIVIVLATTSVLVPIPRGNVESSYLSLLSQLDASGAWKLVEQLARDSFEGRRAGTQGADRASDYITDYFSSIGLKPAGTGGSYKTKFTMPLWDLVQTPSLTLTDSNGTVLSAFGYRKDFNVIPGSGGGDYSTEVVFAGYGITADDSSYDDYAGISARGKIVVVILGTPPSIQSEQDGYESPYSKAKNALRHGAAGLILVDNPTEPTSHYVERRRCGCCWTVFTKLTILGSSQELANTLLRDSGFTVSSVQQKINQGPTPQSFATGNQLHVSVKVTFTEYASAYNVLAFIPGSDLEASRRVVIVGAHYDHWGKDVDGSIYYGANDDASGVAVMLEVVRVFSFSARPRWSVLFAAWSGEEEGFYGAYAYVSHPYFPLEGTIAYLNLDMVGYGQSLLAEISTTHGPLGSAMTESAKELGISLDIEGVSGGSDHVPFMEKNVQSMMFIYWPDDAYHTPADDANHVSKSNLLETAKLTALIALRLSEARVVPMTPAATVTGNATTISASEVTSILEIENPTTTSQQSTTGLPSAQLLVAVSIAVVMVIPAAAFYFGKRRK